MTTGVYAIVNSKNGKAYVGRHLKIEKRWKEHWGLLKDGNHFNPHFQSAYNQDGVDCFTAQIIEECSKDIYIEREDYWMNNWPAGTYNTATAKSGGWTSEMAQKANETQRQNGTLSERNRKAATTQSINGTHSWQNLTSEQLSERAKKSNATARERGTNGRGGSDGAKKGHETRGFIKACRAMCDWLDETQPIHGDTK